MPGSWHQGTMGGVPVEPTDSPAGALRRLRDVSVDCRSDEALHERAMLERSESSLSRDAAEAISLAEMLDNLLSKPVTGSGGESEGARVQEWAAGGASTFDSNSTHKQSFDSFAERGPGSAELGDAWQEIEVLRRRRGSCVSIPEAEGGEAAVRSEWYINVNDVERGEDLQRPASGAAESKRVYRCLIKGTVTCVGKILSLQSEPHTSSLQRILGTLAHLAHPCLAFLVGATTMPDGCVHVFTEDAGGGSLLDYVSFKNTERRASIPQLLMSAFSRSKYSKEVTWLGDVLEALCYLHSPDINCVHGSISLSNILLSKDHTHAKLTDTIINKKMLLNGALTHEHDIRSVGFVVWQLSNSKVIVWGAEGGGEAAQRDPQGGQVYFSTEDEVQAAAISKRGMRALFKACVHQEESSHMPARTAEDLLQVMKKLERMKVLSPLPREAGSSGSWSPSQWMVVDQHNDISTRSFESFTGAETSSALAEEIALDMHRFS